MTTTSPTAPLFYCPSLTDAADVVLSGDEAHHVSVQRVRTGDAVSLFNGRGHAAHGQVTAMDRKHVHVRVQRHERHPPPAPEIDVYSAVPKGDRMTVLLDMTTQLGMSRFTPVQWQRSVVATPSPRAQERWQRVCVEACKQSRRLHVPDVAPLTTWQEAAECARTSGARLLVAHPTAPTDPALLVDADRSLYALFIGPEGGMTDDEVLALRGQGAHLLNLGETILRIETAAVALLAVLGHIFRARKR